MGAYSKWALNNFSNSCNETNQKQSDNDLYCFLKQTNKIVEINQYLHHRSHHHLIKCYQEIVIPQHRNQLFQRGLQCSAAH